MVKFKRNEKTGILEVWKDGKKTGEICTMGDEIIRNASREQKKSEHQ